LSQRMLILAAIVSLSSLQILAQNTTLPSANENKRDPKLLTVTGCLTEGTPAGTFLLTKVPDPLVASVAASGGGAIPTVTYQLSGGQNLRAHVGHKIEVTGRGPLNDQTPVKVVDTETKRPAADANTADKKTPVTEIKEKAAVVVRPLAIESFKMVSTDCTAK